MIRQQRIASIDVFRAITMFLMIFVNDLWSVKNVPPWLEHTEAAADGMGLADTIFPAFLFIVGLSIPFALIRRTERGASRKDNIVYILTRSVALLVMGFFHVNLENYNRAAAIIPKPYWEILITIAFFLIWLDYPQAMQKRKRMLLQACGVLKLVAMAILYRGGEPNNPLWMKPYWWGILGLIGWAYLLSALIFVFSKGKLPVLVGALLFLLLFNIASTAGWLQFMGPVRRYLWIIGNGSCGSLTMAGVVTAVVYRKLIEQRNFGNVWAALMAIATLMLIGGFALRPAWGISKIRATPSWVMICAGLSIVLLVLLIYIVDVRKKERSFSIIKPAGTSTLTCYLLPYIHYSLFNLVGISLPLFVRTGFPGIIKCLLYSLVIILVTGLLEKRRLRLKI